METTNLETIETRVKSLGVNEPPIPAENAGKQRAHGLLRGLVLVLDDCACPQNVIDSFRTQCLAYLTVPSEKAFFNRAKYLTVAPMGRYLRCEPPKAPDAVPVWTGAWKRWSYSRLRSFQPKHTKLWYSFLQAKRSALPASHEMVLATYEAHRESMSQEDPITESVFQVVMKEMGPVLDQVARGVGFHYDANDTWDPMNFVSRGELRHVASTRACYENPRSRGGQLGHLLHIAPALQCCHPNAGTKHRVLPELTRMVFHNFVEISGAIATNVVLEEYEYLRGNSIWINSINREVVRYVGGVTLKCTIQAVLEPLKVRVISKGEAIPYYVSKRLQVAMHDTLRQMSCFRLIGRPMCPTDLLDLAQNRSIVGSGPYQWFSIDYSAATDRLSARLSAAILDRITSRLDSRLSDLGPLWASVLAPHHCEYPKPFDQEVLPVQQRNGQLMGSILSFPVLCLANLGLYLANIAEDSRPLRDKLAGVLVNGDDMLYVARQSMWKTHVHLGETVGLTMSPGKAYNHSVYANVNSACYHLRLDRGYFVDTPRYIPYLNCGLYFGQNKVLGGDDIDENSSLCSVIEPLLLGARNQHKILSGFLKRHSSRIAEECAGRNLFVSTGLGGMGVVPPTGWRVGLTFGQLEHATRKIQDAGPYGYLGYGPLPGRPIREHIDLKAPWLTVEKGFKREVVLRNTTPLLARKQRLKRWQLLQPFRLCAYAASSFQSKTVFNEKRPLDIEWKIHGVHWHGVRVAPHPETYEIKMRKDEVSELLAPLYTELLEYEDETRENLSWLRGFQSD